MRTPPSITTADRAEIMKLADLTADNNDGFGFAFYNASLVRFSIEIAKLRDAQWHKANLSFGELHPANPNAKCKCEHWQSCAECHPTAHGIKGGQHGAE